MSGPIIGLSNLKAHHRGFEHENRGMAIDAVVKASAVMIEKSRDGSSGLKERSSALMKRTKSKVRLHPRRITAKVFNTLPYAIMTEEGTPGHVIRAKNSRVLVFDWPKGGLFPARFAWVQHPGNRPYLWLWSGVLKGYTFLGVELTIGMNKLAAKF